MSAPPAPTQDSAKGSEVIAPAGRSRRAWLVLATTLALALITDLGTKYSAFRWVAGAPVVVDRERVLAAGPGHLQSLIPFHRPRVVIPHVLDLQLVLNSGAVFGTGQGRRGVFVVFTFAALAFALWLFARRTDGRDTIAHVCFGLIIAGGLGNLYDRLRYACVRDFLHPLPRAELPFGLRWPGGDPALWPYVSNAADAWLIVGIGLLMIRLWKSDSRPMQTPPDGR